MSYIDVFLRNFQIEFPIGVKLYLSSRQSASYCKRHEGLLSTSSNFIKSEVFVGSTSVLLHGVLNQLLSVPLNKFKYGKFTIVYTMSESLESDGKITYTLGPSISLLSPTTNSVGIDYSVIASIIRQVLSAQELYGTNVLSSLSLNIYYELKRANMKIRFEDNGLIN